MNFLDSATAVFRLFKTIPFQFEKTPYAHNSNVTQYGDHWYDMTMMLDGKETVIEFTKKRHQNYITCGIHVTEMFYFEASYLQVTFDDKKRSRHNYKDRKLYIYSDITSEDVENIMALIVLCRSEFS